ncbi:hypothetical protein VSDG_03156 [Cytospora chrysosperma]|uniref:HTH APSES-type domain-containing protein n=1 Tax=Cytospora chrysosperma TaxID=252740 RepID=A0A423W8W7_CYTCH|nr:hypothetical protein VSDG_03156 [Valsa sordida]
MDEHIINRLLRQAMPDEGPNTVAHQGLWSTSLAMRPKDDFQFSDNRSMSLHRTSSTTTPPSSPPLLSLPDSFEACSDSNESLETPPSHRLSYQRWLLKDGSPCKDQTDTDTDTYEYMLSQTDGPSDDKRALPVTRNPFLTDWVPAHVDIVASRRLRRLQLDTGVLDFAYVVVPLPEGIISAVFNPSPSSYSLLRRSSDGYFSAMSMLKVAFPDATAREVDSEREYIKAVSTTKPGITSDNFWIDAAFALELAEDYGLLPYVRALLDPADITIQTTSSDGSFEHITAPPRYPPTAVANPSISPVSVDNTTIQTSGDGSPIGPDGKPVVRLFDPRMSLKHQGVPDHLLITLNPTNRVRHLQYINPVTNMLEPDPSSLVITIDGVVYTRGGSHRQGGAIVLLHQTCPWTTLAYLQEWDPHTKEQALLESLCQSLIMIQSLVAADPPLKEVRIMTSSRELCALFGLGMDRMNGGVAAAVEQWLSQTDMSYWRNIDQRWRDITDGNAGRPVDVRLWLVPEEEIQPATEVAIAEIYRGDGRDWYEEHGKGHDLLRPKSDESSHATGADSNGNYCGTDITITIENEVRRFSDQAVFVPPQNIVDQGSEVVARWATETKMMYKQALLYLEVANQGIAAVRSAASKDPGYRRPHKEHWEAYSKSVALSHAQQAAVAHFERFMAEHPVLERARDVEGGQDSVEMDTDAAGGDLVQTVVDMVMMDEKLDQADARMEWE